MIKKILLLILFLLSFNIVFGKIFFNETFEEGSNFDPALPNPIWKLKASYDSSSGLGFPYGEGDLYSVDSNTYHSGNYSLRVTYDARNNWCNMCGSMTGTYEMKTVSTPQNYYEDKDTNIDFLDVFYNLTNPYAIVYNKNDYFTKWDVDYVDQNKIYFKNNNYSQNDMNGLGLFKSGDEIKIPRVCDLENDTYGGKIGTENGAQNYDRRSDCNIAIMWLNNINKTADFDYNGTLTRRFYIYFPTSMHLKQGGNKLTYSRFWKYTTGYEEDILVIRPNGNSDNLNLIFSNRHFPQKLYIFDEFFKRDRWYYIEEIFHRESTYNGSDGYYKLYAGESGSIISNPLIDEKNLTFGPLYQISFLGNWGRYSEDARGSFYIDDIAIADHMLGPIDGNFIPPTPISLINLSSNTLDFGSVPQDFNRTEILEIKNTGDKKLELFSIDYSGDFDFENFCSNSLNEFQSCQLHFAFTNMSIGNYYGELNITTNANNSNFISVPISGDRNSLQFEDLLIGYWNFDNYNQTHILDESSYNISGEIINNPSFDTFNPVSLISNTYVTFDGINDYIQFNDINHFILGKTFSILFWIKPRETDINSRVLGRGGGGGSFSYFFDDNKFIISDTGLYPSDSVLDFNLELNKWQHVAGVYDGNKMQLYVNGSLYDEVSYSQTPYETLTTKFAIGARQNGYNFFNGSIDEVRIYNFSLTPGDIYSQYLKDLNKTVQVSNPSCQEDWDYSTWSTCINGLQNRTATDLNTCGTIINQSSLTQSCTISSTNFCGNNTIEGSEICDGTDLNGTTCQSLGFDKGTLSCKTDCTGYITSSCSNDKNTGGSNTGGGGGGSSSFCYSCIEDINITNTCIPLYQYSEWSDCIDNMQARYVEDLNNCEGDEYEQRSCQIDLSEEENLLLNAKLLLLNNYANKKYKTSLDSGYNEIFYVEEQLEDNIFLLQDEATGREYYGQYYDTIEDKHYYTLKRVDAGYITILQDEGILGASFGGDKSSENSLLTYLVVGFVIILFVGSLGYAVYYIKKNKIN